MGLFDIVFGRRPKPRGGQTTFEMLNGYTPRFTSWHGELYENELIRAAIHARATHISKLKVEINGAARPTLQRKLTHGPNQFQTWSQFMYRLSTLLDIYNTAFIVPIYDQFGEVSGVFVPLPKQCEIVQYGDKQYLRYEFAWKEKAAIELDLCGILSGSMQAGDLFPAVIPGVFYLLMGRISGDQIGRGDGLTILVLGLFAGLPDTVLITAAAQFICAVLAGLMLVMKRADRNTRIPFVPFLLAAAAGLYLKGGGI